MVPSFSVHELIVVTLIALGCFIIAWVHPTFGEFIFGPVERLGAKLAERKGLAVLAVATATIFLRLCLMPLLHVPLPVNPDEFSYLLAPIRSCTGASQTCRTRFRFSSKLSTFFSTPHTCRNSRPLRALYWRSENYSEIPGSECS
jgi:hypothetical protein